MKIGIVCYPSVGGSGIVATELGKELAKRGHSIHFITYEVPFRLELDQPNIHFHQVEINRYDLFKYPDYALTLAVKIADVAKHHKLDAIHVHYAIPHATSAYLATQLLQDAAPTVITTLHGTDITLVGKEPAYLEIVKFSIDQSDVVTAVSDYLKKETERTFSTKTPIHVIPNFVNPGTPSLLHKTPRLLHSSNFRPVKRVPDVIATFAKIRKKIPATLALLGPITDEIRTLIKEEGLSNCTEILGEQRDIHPHLEDADLFLLPSEHESFGLAALEAMAYGVPVIGSNAGGLPELIKHEKSGMLAATGDTQAMADHALTLLQNPTLYTQISQNAYDRAKSTFSPEKVIPQYEKLYSAKRP